MKKFYHNLYQTQVKVGVFTLLILAVLVVGYLWLSSRINAKRQRQVHISFDEIIGLEVGDKAMFRGMEVGRVKRVEARPSDILVTANIDHDIRLKEGAVFYVAMTSLMGGSALNISQGTGDGYIDLRAVQKGIPPVGMTSIMVKVSATVEELHRLLADLRSEQGVIAKSAALVDNANMTVSTVNGLAANTDLELSRTLDRIQEMTGEVKNLVNANSANVSSLLGSAPNTLAGINSTVDSLQILSRRLGETVNAMNSGKGTAGKLINDDMLYKKLTSSVADLDSLLLDIKANPKRYVRFSLF